MARGMPSRMAADWSQADQGPPPSREVDEDQADELPDEDQADELPDDEDQADEDQADEPEGSPRNGGGFGQDGAGWVLGLLFWGWVALPFVQGGPGRVKSVLMAKFLNRAGDGTELP